MIRMVDAFTKKTFFGDYEILVRFYRKKRIKTYHIPTSASITRLQRTVSRLVKSGKFELAIPAACFLGWRARRK